MRTLRILHAADLHLDSPFEGLGAAKAKLRREEQRELLEKLRELVTRCDIDLVLLSGDLLDSADSFLETGEQLARSLRSMNAPVFIAPGNHDYYSAYSPYARLKFSDNVHIFKKNSLECAELERLGVRVYGAAYIDRSCPPLLDGFRAEKKDGFASLLCLHAEVGNPRSVYCPVTERQLAESGLDYAAFGHIHQASGLKKAGETWYSWPGCPEGRGFDETGDRFVNIVTLGDGGCQLEQISIAKRRYQLLKTDINELPKLLATLPDGAVNDIYRIVLSGECEDAPNLREVYDTLSERFFALQLCDRTHIRAELWERAGEDSLRGIFLGKLRALYDGTEDKNEKAKIEQAARWGLAALDRREELVTHDDP